MFWWIPIILGGAALLVESCGEQESPHTCEDFSRPRLRSSQDAGVDGAFNTLCEQNCSPRINNTPLATSCHNPQSHVSQPLFQTNQTTDIFLRYDSFLPSSISDYIYFQSRACSQLLSERYGFTFSGINTLRFRVTVNCHGNSSDELGITLDPRYLAFNPYQARVDPRNFNNGCFDSQLLKELSHYLAQEGPFYSSLGYGSFCNFFLENQPSNFSARILSRGLATYLGRMADTIRYPVPSETQIDLEPIRRASDGFTACLRSFNEGEPPGDPRCPQLAFPERETCCLRFYSGVQTFLNIQINNSVQVISTRLLLATYYSIENPSQILLEELRLFSHSGTEEIRERFLIPNASSSSAWAWNEYINPLFGRVYFHAESILNSGSIGTGRLYLFNDFAQGRDQIQCATDSYQVVRTLFLEDGREWRLSEHSNSFTDPNLINNLNNADLVGVCFWRHLEETYGHDRFVDLVRYFQRHNTNLICDPFNLVRTIAEKLGSDENTIQNDMSRFGINPELLQNLMIPPLCPH